MKKTWIALTLAGALCVPLAGCAGDKTGGNLMPGSNPTAQVTPGNDFGETNTDAANGGNNVSGADVGDPDARSITGRVNNATGMGRTNSTTGTSNANSSTGTGRSNDSALERVGEGVKDTLDDMGSAARSMAQDAKRMVK